MGITARACDKMYPIVTYKFIKVSLFEQSLIMLLDCAFRAGVRVEVVICTRVTSHTSCLLLNY
jgi:hypothetical protein